MRVWIPTVGSVLVLTRDWEFELFNEHRNNSFVKQLGLATAVYWSETPVATQQTIPVGTELTVDRIYIRKNASEFDSLTFRVTKTRDPNPIPKVGTRFWAKLHDVNQMECDPVSEADVAAREAAKRAPKKKLTALKTSIIDMATAINGFEHHIISRLKCCYMKVYDPDRVNNNYKNSFRGRETFNEWFTQFMSATMGVVCNGLHSHQLWTVVAKNKKEGADTYTLGLKSDNTFPWASIHLDPTDPDYYVIKVTATLDKNGNVITVVISHKTDNDKKKETLT